MIGYRSRYVFALLLAAVLVVCLIPAASAAGASVTFKENSLVVTSPGSAYADTDLFGGLGDAMPGDRLSAEITVQNMSSAKGSMDIYIRALPHDTGTNPISEPVQSELAGDSRRGEMSEIEYMNEFLSQLTLTVKAGGTVIFKSSPDKPGGLASDTLIGTLENGERAVLEIELEVPIELDNRYAGRIGEVDWVFTASEQAVEPVKTSVSVNKVWADNGKNRPSSVTIALYNGKTQVDTVTLSSANSWTHTWTDLDGSGDWHVRELDVPAGYTATYKDKDGVFTITNTSSLIQTGQLVWPIRPLTVLGALLIAAGVVVMRRKRRNEKA